MIQVSSRAGHVVIQGGTVIDGTGTPPRPADVLLAGDRVVALEAPGTFEPDDGYEVLDARGLVVTPGFIDPHSHADRSPMHSPDDTSKILQGITTEVVGNCGLSPDLQPGQNFDDHFAALDAAGYVTNYCPLVGHGTLRKQAMGMRRGAPEPAEARRMAALLDEALDAGAWGVSSGLFYAPSSFADADEMVELVRRLPAGAIYATHMRDEGRHLQRSVEEALDVGARSGARLQISHLKAAGPPFWGGVDRALSRIAAARSDGVDVNQDVYPYDASSTFLRACLPPWLLDGDDETVLGRLADPDIVRHAQDEVEDPADNGWENIVAAEGYDRIVIASTRSHRYEGQTLAELAEELGVSGFDVLVHLLRTEGMQVFMVDFSMSEADVERVMIDPRTSICTDGAPIEFGGKPHPRLYGSFPRVLGRYVRDRKTLDLSVAIHKMTGLTAEVFGVPERGLLTAGMIADIVAFDPATVADTATFTEPAQAPDGVRWVMQSGVVVARDGRWLGTRRGSRLAQARS